MSRHGGFACQEGPRAQMQPDVSVGKPSPGANLAPGTTLAGGQLQIHERLEPDPFGTAYRARSGDGSSEFELLVLQPAIAAAADQLAREVALASALKHKNILEVYGVQQEAGWTYVVEELPAGQSLQHLMAKKRGAGQSFSLKAAYNIVAHVCNALAHAHGSTVHGALRASAIMVDTEGRVKVGDFGLGWARSLVGLAGAPGETAAAPTVRGDIHAIGTILYQLLLGDLPGASPKRPSAVVAGLPPAIDGIVARCLNPSPEARFASVAELKDALATVVEGAPAAARVSAQHPAVSARGPLPAAPGVVPVGTQPGVSSLSGSGPRLPPRPVAAMSFDAGGDLSLGGEANFHSAVNVHEDDERWLVQKDKLDFGPFSLKEIKRQIDKGDILGHHTLACRDTGERGPVRAHPLLSEVVREAEQKFELQRRAQAEAVVVKREKRGGAALYGFFALIAVALGVGGYFVYTKLIRPAKKTEFKLSAAEIEVGSIAAEAGSSPTGGPKRTGGGKRSGGGGGGDGWVDETNLGDASQGGGSETLPTSVIDGVLAKNAGRFASCVHGSVRISFQIMGSGKVGGVRVTGGGDGAANCIRPRLQAVRFPSFDGSKMAANFSMSVD